MRLTISEIIEAQGSIPFEFQVSEEWIPDSVEELLAPIIAKGVVSNKTGVIFLHGEIYTRMLLRCDRCAVEFEREKRLSFELRLLEQGSDYDGLDVFFFEGDVVDLNEIMGTCLLLDMEMKNLCKPDCAGLCTRCGADLNYGKCSCAASLDPRLSKLLEFSEN